MIKSMASTITLTLSKDHPCDSRENHKFLWSSGDFSRTLLTSQFSDTDNIGHEDCYKCLKSKNGSIMTKVDVPCKLLVIGDAGVGKTSFVQRYINKMYRDTYRWTVGVDFALKVVKWSDNVSVKLQLWDIAGQERFTSMTRVYYKDAHACIIMFDLSQRQTFLNALKWKRDLDSKCTLPDGRAIPCILLANKCDLKHREVEQSEIESFCKEQEFIGWTEVSVKEGLMVEEAMRFLLSDMMSRYNESTLSASTNEDRILQTVKLNSTEANKQSKCKC